MKGVYIFLADGFEDIEALATRDVLQRGGIDVRTVSLSDDLLVQSSHGIQLFADSTWEEFLSGAEEEGTVPQDMLIFPGGMPGSRTLAENQELISLMNRHYAEGGSVAAICAAPGLVLSQLNGIEGHKVTCFDGFENYLTESGAVYIKEGTVTDGRIVSGRGAGHAINFGLAILSFLSGPEAAEKVKSGMML